MRAKITTIELEGDLYLQGDISQMFASFPALTAIHFNDHIFDTSKIYSMFGLFKDDTSLIKVDLSGLQTQNLTNFSRVFQNDTSLTEVKLPTYTDQVRDFSALFASCSSLTTISGIDSWTGSNATNVASMFDGDAKLEKLDLTKFNPSKATDFSYMFYHCTALSSVGDLSKWTGSNATNVSSMFDGDEALTSLDLTNFNPSGATSFLGMFSGCSKLTSVGDLNKWTGSNATNVAYMFNGDEKLTPLDLTNFNPRQATDFSAMFSNCKALKNMGNLSKWTGSNATNVTYMFNGCDALESLDLTNFNPSQATNLSAMFSYCGSLKDLSSINSWHIEAAEDINYMFLYDSKLTKPIVLNNSNDPNNSSVQKNKLGSAKQTFAGCSQLTQLDISKLNLTQADRTDFLNGCNNLWYLTLGKNSVLTNSSLPNAPDSDNPKDYPGDPDNKKLICDSGTWIDKSEISDTSSTKKQYTSSDLCNLTLEDLSKLTSAGSKTFVWTPTAVTANLVGFPKNIKFNLMNTGIGTTVQGSDVQDPDNSFSVYDTTGHLEQNSLTTVSAKLISQSTNESDDNPVVFVGHNNHQLRKSQIQLAIGINNLNRLAGDIVLDTDFKPIIQYSPSSNNFKYKFNSQFKLSTYNSVVYLPDSYRATIEYQVTHSVT
ncbi:MAG: BspA family leucine-rich repeat surface protein [Bombilactobacillus mellifer]|uniref:BspA family leucine-rich repeat surface protein n=1 Tax=Bombilactobacillus mellifer TaxID=1218492 RepID=UPI0023F1342E|nr:BspA family leucine-rich repeat surface protein [Bombilactobacillus mellifer]MCT6843406.1 BspA family leucine-rich repeat surface protein [Bombilactobacillus mellifer]